MPKKGATAKKTKFSNEGENKSKKILSTKFIKKNQSKISTESSLPRQRNSLYPITQSPLKIERSSSQTAIIEYFGDDEADALSRKKIKDPYFYHSATVNFSLSQYFEFFLIHFLAYSLMGPLINIYSLVVWRNRYLMSNLMFWRLLPSFFIQHGFWFINMLVYMVLVKKPNASIGDFSTIIIMICQQLLRASSIAGKYATFPPNLINKLKEKEFTFKEIMRELMLVGWMSQTSSVHEQEIAHSMSRLEIDNTMLKIAFITELSDTTLAKFDAIEKAHIKGYFEHLEHEGKELIHLKYYDGKLIFEHLLNEFNAQGNITVFGILRSVILCLVFTFLPGMIRIYYKQSFHGEGAIEIAIFYLNCVVTFMTMLSIVMFFDRSLVDLARRNFLLQQLGQMMSPKKLTTYSERKVLPTIHLFDQISLRSWTFLRKMSIDYGSKYLFRHEIMMPVLMIISSLSIMALICLQWVYQTNNPDLKIEIEKLKITLLFLFFIFFGMVAGMLYSAASVNSHFEEHTHVLKNNKEIYNDIRIFQDVYFKRHLLGIQHQEEPNIYKIDNIIKEDSCSLVHKTLAKEISLLLGDKLGVILDPFLQEMIRICENNIEDMMEEEEFNSLEMLGFTVTGSAVNNFIIAYVSILATSIEFLSSWRQ